MYQRLYQTDVSIGGPIPWKKCNLNYDAAIQFCTDEMNSHTTKDFRIAQRFYASIQIFTKAKELGATFYAVDASAGSFVLAFLFEKKSTLFSFIEYCNGLATETIPIKAIFVPLTGER